MPADRSHRTTQGTQNAAARAWWRAMGTAVQDLNRPIIAIANSFNQFVPGHMHLKDLGHISPEAAKGGLIALVQNGDEAAINIPDRKVSRALRAFAALVRGAVPGAVRDPGLVDGQK